MRFDQNGWPLNLRVARHAQATEVLIRVRATPGDLTLLVKAGADTEIKDRQGTTALGHARARGYQDMITILQAATGRRT